MNGQFLLTVFNILEHFIPLELSLGYGEYQKNNTYLIFFFLDIYKVFEIKSKEERLVID